MHDVDVCGIGGGRAAARSSMPSCVDVMVCVCVCVYVCARCLQVMATLQKIKNKYDPRNTGALSWADLIVAAGRVQTHSHTAMLYI